MKHIVLSNWNFMRFFRLFIGLAVLLQAVAARDWLFGFAGVLFSGLAVFNIACCGVGGCPTYIKSKNNEGGQEITYEELDK